MPDGLIAPSCLGGAALWIVTMGGMVSAGAAAMGAPSDAGPEVPVIVLAAPWGAGAVDVAERAGAMPYGPLAGTGLATVVIGASAEALRAAGAWAVLPLPEGGFLCGDGGAA